MNDKASLVVSIILSGIIGWSIAVIPLVHAQAGQVTIDPAADTYVDSNSPYENTGGQAYLSIYKSEYSEERIWLRFDLSSVPDGAIVDVAALRLHCSWYGSTYNLYAYSSSDTSWTEYDLTWANMPSYDTTPLAVEQIVADNTWYLWSVTRAVQEGVDGIQGEPGAVTIVLMETSVRGYNSVSFDSKEALIDHPELIVHWSGIVPEFPSGIVLPLFLVATAVAVGIYKRRAR